MLSDYLKACQESMEKDYTEIQEIWVWNLVTNNYDKIDFIELIKLAEKKEKELQEKEDLKNKQLEESDNKNLEFENKKTTKYLELEFLKELKLELTSEKSSEKYSNYISNIVKKYNKSYNLKIQDLEVYISQKNKNKEYYRYIFSNIEDLESLKKAFNQYAQPTYIDLDNKAPSIYYKK